MNLLATATTLALITATPTLAQIQPNTLNGTLDSNSRVQTNDNSYFNTHTFEGQTGEQITIDLTSSEFDSYLILLDPENNKIAENDDGGEGKNARIIVTLPATGTYTILANSCEAEQTGNYTLSWRETTAEELELTEAEQLNQQAFGLSQQGQYAEAIPLAEQALAIQEKVLGAEHPDVATSLNNLATLYQNMGNYTEAEPLFQRSLAIREKIYGTEHPDVAISLNNLANLYQTMGNYRQAKPLFQRSLAILEKVYGTEHPAIAISLNNLATLYQNIGNYTDAEPLLQRSLAIREKIYGTEHPDVAQSLNNLAYQYERMGNYGEAESLYQRSLAIQEKVLPAEHPDVAISLNNLANLYQTIGNYDEAEPLLQRSLAILEKVYGTEHPAIATSLNNLALLYVAMGNYGEAEPLFQQTLAMREKVLPAEHPDVAVSLNNLASLYRDIGNYSRAETLFQRSRTILENVYGAEHPDVAGSLDNLASLYLQMGNYSQAEPLFQQARAIREKVYGAEHPLVAQSLNNLARLYHQMKNYSQAEPLFQQARVISEKVYGAEHPEVTNILNNLAALYSDTGNYREAKSLYQRVLAIREQVLPAEHPHIALSLNNLALLYQKMGNYSQAEPRYQQSLAIFEKVYGAEHPDVAISLSNLATLYQDQGNIPRATEFFTRSLNIEEHNFSHLFTTGSEKQKQAYVNFFRATVDQIQSFHLQSAPNDPQAARLALTTLLRRKGRILDALSENLQLVRQNLTPENQTLLDDLIATRSHLAALVYRRPEDIPNLDTHRQLIATLTTDADNLEAELARRSAQFRVATQPVDIAAVQAKIPANGVLVEYVLYKPYNAIDDSFGEPRYAAYLLFPNGNLQSIDLGDAAPIDAAIESFRSLLQDPSTDLRAGARPQLRLDYVERVTTNIKTLVFDPIAPYLADTEHLLISPDSQLNRLPFEALQPEFGGDYLVQQYQISYLSTGRDLVKFGIVPPSNEPAVVLANPDYDSADGSVQLAQAAPAQNEKLGEENRSFDNNRRSTELSQLQVGPLPGTAAEVEAIRSLLNNPTILTTTQATENTLKSVRHPRILHIATHGFFLADVERTQDSRGGFRSIDDPLAAPVGESTENPLLRSGLALAGFNPRISGSEDGVLTALEASQLNLFGTQLVVLSACETGLGDVANGEGVYGLRRAFSLAGAQTQLMSLWQVSDEGTQKLMARYYEKLMSGKGRSQALREVQLESISGEGKYSRPYYWAAFILAGEWD